MIPKIVHYCWLSGDPIPEKLQKCMESWKKYLPDYEFMLWDRNRFDINSSLWTKQAFEAKKYAFAADYIRLYAVYHYGGIYMDMDVEVVKSFNILLEHKYIFGQEASEGIEAGIFGVEKNDKNIKSCLDYYTNRSFIKENGEYDIKPLPLIMYEIFSKHNTLEKRDDINFINKENIIYLFPPQYLTAKSSETGIVTITNNTFSIHHFAGSWVSNSRKIGLWIRKKFGDKVFNFIYSIIKLIKN